MKAAFQRFGGWSAALMLGACGPRQPASTDRIADVPFAQQRVVSTSQFGLAWPFVAESIVLGCAAGGVFAHIDGTDYALNAAAASSATPLPDARRILEYPKWPPSNPVSRLRQARREAVFSEFMACDPSGHSPVCRSRIAERFDLTDGELEQISVEGRERIWAPLVRRPHHLDAVLQAGLMLCR